MAKYKEKDCALCEQKYFPTSPKQKYCMDCKEEGRRITARKRDRTRNRKKYKYSEYTRNCKHCGVEFKTHYSKKVYCGAEKCETVRVQIKNKRTHLKRSKEYMVEKGRKYYKKNRARCLKHKALQYRRKFPEAKPYIPGKIYNLTLEYVRDYISGKGYKLLTDEYINNTQPLLLECPEGHKWKTTFHGFKDCNNTCFRCYLKNSFVSKFELSVKEYVASIYSGTVVYNDRSNILSPITGRQLELDLWFPDLNKAIECNGVYWHSKPERIENDLLKLELCGTLDIDLLIVTDEEWNSSDTKIKIDNFMVNQK